MGSLGYEGTPNTLWGPLIGSLGAITPNDDADLAHGTRQLRITGDDGNICVIWYDGTESIEPVSAGDVLDWRVKRIKATGTTATGIRGYY